MLNTSIASAIALRPSVEGNGCASMARRTIAATPFSKTTKATPRLAYWFRCLSVKNGSTLTTSNLSGGIVIAETFLDYVL
jgi:hypothetical protein